MYKVVALSGDGIGAEVTAAALEVLEVVRKKTGLEYELSEGLVGGASIDVVGVPIADDVLQKCKDADAVLLGAIGGPKWDDLPIEQRPEWALLKLRKELDVYTNLRPIKIYDQLKSASPLKEKILNDVDLLIVRELTGGLYFGQPKGIEPCEDGEIGIDTMSYKTWEIERAAVAAFEAASKRSKRVMSVDKANILASSALWRKTVTRIAEDYPEIALEHMLVDTCAMQLVRNPGQFDVILTENTFGDILSDEAAMLTGSLGMLPSASFGAEKGMYEPVHGSAPDIMGKNIANPIAAINSVAMMVRYSMKNEEVARIIEDAVEAVLEDGFTTADLKTPDSKLATTTEFTAKVIEKTESRLNSI